MTWSYDGASESRGKSTKVGCEAGRESEADGISSVMSASGTGSGGLAMIVREEKERMVGVERWCTIWIVVIHPDSDGA